jgi:hypothetical protein
LAAKLQHEKVEKELIMNWLGKGFNKALLQKKECPKFKFSDIPS